MLTDLFQITNPARGRKLVVFVEDVSRDVSLFQITNPARGRKPVLIGTDERLHVVFQITNPARVRKLLLAVSFA